MILRNVLSQFFIVKDGAYYCYCAYVLCISRNIIISIYNSLISPYISYGLIAWGQASKTHLEKILILQKRAVRLINFLPFRTHAIPYFAQSNILPITVLYFKLSSTLMLDITTPHLKISAIFLLLHKTYISIIPAQHLLVTTILIILGSIIIKTIFPSLGLKSGTAFPKATEDYQSTYSKRKLKHYYLKL